MLRLRDICANGIVFSTAELACADQLCGQECGLCMHAGKLFVKYGVPKGLQSSSLEKVLSQVQNCPVDQQLQCGHKGTTHSQLLSNPYCAR